MQVRLLSIDESLLASLDSPEAFRRVAGSEVGEHLDLAREVVEMTVDLVRDGDMEPPWGGYLVVSPDSNGVVGAAGFKGGPGADGAVEIAYYTFPAFEGRGIASAAAVRLVELAGESADVRAVVAHTLPERNASCRILEKTGFRYEGEVLDPEDGPVWRWRRDLATEA